MSALQRLRHIVANIPFVSYVAFRWQVLFGSEVVDYALTRAAAERRAKQFVYAREVGLLAIKRRSAMTIERVR